MAREFHLIIKLRNHSNQHDKKMLWNGISSCLQSIRALGKPIGNRNNADWGIDYSESNLEEYEVKKHIASFLEDQTELINDFSFYKL